MNLVRESGSILVQGIKISLNGTFLNRFMNKSFEHVPPLGSSRAHGQEKKLELFLSFSHADFFGIWGVKTKNFEIFAVEISEVV
jgi:hypothetical protein